MVLVGRLECEPRPPFLLVPPTRVTQPLNSHLPLQTITQRQSDAGESVGKEGTHASEEELGNKVGDMKENHLLSSTLPDNLIVGHSLSKVPKISFFVLI